MSARERSKELFDESGIENTPRNWHIWKRAFDAGFVHANRPILMSEEDSKVFFEALENPAEPTEALKAAMKRYNEYFKPEE